MFMARFDRGRSASAIRSVFQPLFLDLLVSFPDNRARPGIDKLERVQDIVARSLACPCGHALQLARKEKIRAAKLDEIRVAAAGDLSGLFQLPLAIEHLHLIAREKGDLSRGVLVEQCTNPVQE